MHLKGLEGSWLKHDFWKTRFLIEDEETLGRLFRSGATECWIDVSLGMDVAEVATSEPTPQQVVQQVPAPEVRKTSLADELANAAAIREKAKSVLSGLFQEARMGGSIDTAQCVPLVNDVVDSIHRNGEAFVSLSRLKLADEYTYMHSVAVCALMVSLGKQIGLDDQQCREAGMAGLLHDLGKAAMPIDVLNKPGGLTDAEFAVMREHPVRGWEMLREAGVRNEWVLDVVRHHHERVDGKGYPDRLSGDALTQIARMGAICDVYDAITSNRPYKGAWDPAESNARMASTWKGHFDPDLLKAFIRAVGIYPTGSMVRLDSGHLAIVLEQNPQRLTCPKVKIFFSTQSGVPLRPEVMDLAENPGLDKIESREDPAHWNFGHLNSLWAGDTDIALALDGQAK